MDKEHQSLFIRGLQDGFLHQHVTEPTRYRDNETPTLLDLVISNEESMVTDLEYFPPLGESDHVCLRFNVNCTQEADTNDTDKLNIFKTKYANVIEELSHFKWEDLLNSSFHEDYSTFFDKLQSSMEKQTPLRTPRKREKKLYN